MRKSAAQNDAEVHSQASTQRDTHSFSCHMIVEKQQRSVQLRAVAPFKAVVILHTLRVADKFL